MKKKRASPGIIRIDPILFLQLFFMFQSVAAFSQDNYATMIRNHRFMYKKDLTGIIHQDTAFVKFYDANPAFKLVASFSSLRNEPVFSMNTSSGASKKAQKIGTATFTIDGKKYTLAAYQLLDLRTNPETQDYFFIPFTDITSGGDTYGAGRYLDFKLGDIKKGKTLTIDFNKAYNPYCAFVDGYSCPVPPAENQLEVEITAGEKKFEKKAKVFQK